MKKQRRLFVAGRGLRLTLCLVLILSLAAALVLPGTPLRSNAAGGTITLSIERFTLGGGFIVEPRVVSFNPGDNYATVITNEIAKAGYSIDYDGTLASGFYLKGILGTDVSSPQPPAAVQSILDEKGMTLSKNSNRFGLFEKSYTSKAGWMYYVNGEWRTGMSLVPVQDGDVCRLMYTLTLGADLTGAEYDSDMETLTHKYYDKDLVTEAELVKEMAKMNGTRSEWEQDTAYVGAYNYAESLLARMDARTAELEAAILNLQIVQEQPPKKEEPAETEPSQEPTKPTVDPEKTAFAQSMPGVTIDKSKVTDSSVTLSWSACAHADSYEVLRRTAGGTFKTIASGVKKRSYTDKTVKANTTYYYGVRAVSDYWGKQTVSKYETGKSVKTPKLTVGQAKGVKVSSAAYNKLKVSWGKVSKATGYKVYRSTKKSSGYKAVKTVSGTSFTDTGLKTGTTYYYKVAAVRKANGQSVTGKQSAVKSGKPALGQVKKLSAKSSARKRAVLSWKKVSGATGYKVYRSAKKSSGYKFVRTQKGTKWTNTKLTSKKTYYYKVKAYRTVGGKKVDGTASAPVKVKVK